ncbi:polyadenylate-binding protein RBP45-like protein isoform X1 [Tanacetum coccineum]
MDGSSSRGSLPPLSNYRMGRRLGFGAFGTVREAQHISTGIKVAMKKLIRQTINDSASDSWDDNCGQFDDGNAYDDIEDTHFSLSQLMKLHLQLLRPRKRREQNGTTSTTADQNRSSMSNTKWTIKEDASRGYQVVQSYLQSSYDLSLPRHLNLHTLDSGGNGSTSGQSLGGERKRERIPNVAQEQVLLHIQAQNHEFAGTFNIEDYKGNINEGLKFYVTLQVATALHEYCRSILVGEKTYGKVASVKIIRNKQSGQPEGYGFIEFRSRVGAENALQTYNGTPMPNSDLAADVSDYVLQELFKGTYPSCKLAKVVTDRTTRRSKGYRFVRFRDESEQMCAMIEMNGVVCSSRPMQIGPTAC